MTPSIDTNNLSGNDIGVFGQQEPGKTRAPIRYCQTSVPAQLERVERVLSLDMRLLAYMLISSLKTPIINPHPSPRPGAESG